MNLNYQILTTDKKVELALLAIEACNETLTELGFAKPMTVIEFDKNTGKLVIS